MKKLSAIFAIVAMVFLGAFANAQSVASIDYENILAAMPETKRMSQDLDAWAKMKGDDLRKQGSSFEEEVKKYQAGASALSEDQRKAREAELQKKGQSLQALEQTAQQELEKKRTEMLNPIIKKLNDAVAKVSKANNYAFVLDNQNLVYRGGPEITSLVKKELGL